MDTKVGAFKKDGTVQCVKLVEEVGTIFDITRFSGKLVNGTVVYDNGIIFEVLTKSGSHLNLDSSNIVTIGTTPQSQSTSPQSTIRSTISSTDEITSTIVNNEYYQEVSNLKIWMVIIQGTQFSGGEQLIVTYDDGKTYNYSPGSGTSSQVMFANASNYAAYISVSDRVLPPTVRMCKDGTLKCAKLIEEAAVEDSSRLSMSQKTDALTLSYFNYDIRLLNPGGQSITIPSSYSELGYVTLLDSSGTQLNFSRSYSGGDDWTGSKNPSWISGTVSIVRFTVGGTIKDSASQIAFVDNGTKQTQSARTIYFTKDSSGYYNNTSTPVTFNYDWLLKTPTVRVYKDGTIKCAEVQEATLRSKLNEFSGSSTLPPSSGVVTCTNGLKISIGAYSFPGSSGDAYTFVFRDENYRDFLKIIGKGASTTITSALDTSNASIWNQLSDITISEIKLDYLSTTTMPSSLVITWKGKSYTYSLYPSSTNPYSKLYRPSSSQVVLSVLDRVSFTWTS